MNWGDELVNPDNTLTDKEIWYYCTMVVNLLLEGGGLGALSVDQLAQAAACQKHTYRRSINTNMMDYACGGGNFTVFHSPTMVHDIS